MDGLQLQCLLIFGLLPRFNCLPSFSSTSNHFPSIFFPPRISEFNAREVVVVSPLPAQPHPPLPHQPCSAATVLFLDLCASSFPSLYNLLTSECISALHYRQPPRRAFPTLTQPSAPMRLRKRSLSMRRWRHMHSDPIVFINANVQWSSAEFGNRDKYFPTQAPSKYSYGYAYLQGKNTNSDSKTHKQYPAFYAADKTCQSCCVFVLR